MRLVNDDGPGMFEPVIESSEIVQTFPHPDNGRWMVRYSETYVRYATHDEIVSHVGRDADRVGRIIRSIRRKKEL